MNCWEEDIRVDAAVRREMEGGRARLLLHPETFSSSACNAAGSLLGGQLRGNSSQHQEPDTDHAEQSKYPKPLVRWPRTDEPPGKEKAVSQRSSVSPGQTRIRFRDAGTATEFMQDLESRLAAPRVQITTDGHKMYLTAVEDAFGSTVDYAQLVKTYGADPEPEKRYSPAKVIGCATSTIQGNPDPWHVSTSYVERQNLNMRMSMRRFTRLTNGFSKKVENFACAVSLHFMHHNWCRPHRTLRTKRNNRVTPAMACGLTDRPWPIKSIVRLLESKELNRRKAS